MRLVAHEFMTLDGVMQGPGRRDEDTEGGFRWGGWVAPSFDEAVGEVVSGWFERTDALLFGRRTYDMMAGYWPQVTDDGDPVAQRLSTAPKHVVSTTLRLDEAPWAVTESVIADDVPERIRALKSTGDGELQVHGSWRLLQTLIAEHLLDELRLIVFPVIVGEGKRVFDRVTQPTGFEVAGARVAPSGAVAMSLTPARSSTAARSRSRRSGATSTDVAQRRAAALASMRLAARTRTGRQPASVSLATIAGSRPARMRPRLTRNAGLLRRSRRSRAKRSAIVSQRERCTQSASARMPRRRASSTTSATKTPSATKSRAPSSATGCTPTDALREMS